MQYSGLQVLGDGGHQEGRSTWDMLPTFEAGWSDHALSSLFDQIPATLRSELLQGLRVFDGIKQARQLNFAVVFMMEYENHYIIQN